MENKFIKIDFKKNFTCGKINSQVKSFFYLILWIKTESFPQNCEVFPQICGKLCKSLWKR
ncbi:hypothetical protein EFO20_01215 [Lactococcus lactis]|nr:hypothetical protein [Lactococcus lactis subsp. lactis]MCT3084940.1 hypothetical protein [Lactococcus lactis]MCT3106939.1 hypothetical protein [Lactococcus lactis]MCT3112358.1 hypothetical protein [Lactococcus lactis]PFG90809.1 hypothetical protein BW155_11650 [Lactococcus lactis subsp. lactis]